ncbi:acid phosphatase [Novosphingobium album (ex Hu et al. 2023)]|uniref:phospholipase C n=1 Tax=Novosphingobium album (ex Hu et al. 2023) TaxID=2930093 RepID=A0ABT0B1M1_9SPHN|nr:acid phosphatase [Novosphingobium album (ex Hu et al. 2023)]MCJ2178915.1 acid phosphatase [Novosphingobium album (ex Hu et al. 2023)]
MSDPDSLHPDRREFLGGLAAALGAAAVTGGAATEAEARSSKPAHAPAVSDARLRDAIDTVVVIYAENRSFNNLFADFPGLEQPLSKVPPERFIQRDRDGTPLEKLPKIWEGLVPDKQVVEHAEYQIGPDDLPLMPNAPFALKTPAGDPLPHGLVTRDLIHAFYHNQLQINGGRNDGFAAWGDSGGLVMGYYGDNRSQLRLWQIAREFTLCDNFFMGAFGGSFLNHQYLIAAQPPVYPGADKSPAANRIAQLEGSDPRGIRLKLDPKTPASAMDGPARFVPSSLTPDFWAVNTMLPPYAPTYQLDPARPGYSDWSSGHTLVPQQHKTLGDVLSAKGINWAWYAGGWKAALDGHANDGSYPSRPNFQPHHQPFNYFNRFAPGTADRAAHLRDAGEGSTGRTNHFLADAEAGKLPPVTFYKPQGDLNMHAGYSDVDAGDRHISAVVDALRVSPQWERMLVVITFDENGGWWDHVAPPKGDRWGPGTRIPAMVVSPHVRKGSIDHTIYDTGSIARFITRRFGLEKLPGLAMREQAMVAAGGVAPGDLTGALDLA